MALGNELVITKFTGKHSLNVELQSLGSKLFTSEDRMVYNMQFLVKYVYFYGILMEFHKKFENN